MSRPLPPGGMLGSWPVAGKVELKDVVLSYRAGLDPALQGVTFSVNPGEKIGICGRTYCPNPLISSSGELKAPSATPGMMSETDVLK